MDLVGRFKSYMRDFELTSVDDNWERIRAHLTDDFVHERDVKPLMRFRDEGADVAIAKWQEDVEHLDKQFDRRVFVPLGPPEEAGNVVRLRWVFLGVLEGSPTFVDEGVEVAEFRGGLICYLRGEYSPFAIDRMKRWGREFGHLVPKIAEHARLHRGAGR